MKILVLNPGSSSLKSRLYQFPGEQALPLPLGQVDSPGVNDVVRAAGPVEAFGVRVVHGGSRFEKPSIVTNDVLGEIEQLASLAPLHNPIAVKVIRELSAAEPAVPIVAVFDTSFHVTMPPVASTYAIPADLQIRRYGFHGISYSYVSKRLQSLHAGSRVIVAHLGNGASICAVRDGLSIDTSMGLTPTEGLVMGTRSGDLDPGAILYLLRNGRSTAEVDDLLNHHSGLLGLSGTSGDMRKLEIAADSGDEQATLALEIFAYRVAKYIGSYAVALNGVDAVAFTGGIGEHSSTIRKLVCDRLSFLGIVLDAERNDAQATTERRISSSEPAVWVVPTNEEIEIARATLATIGQA